jgi:phosphohistidine swiveling domain-containing protein
MKTKNIVKDSAVISSIKDNRWDYLMSNKIHIHLLDMTSRAYSIKIKGLLNLHLKNVVMIHKDGRYDRYVMEGFYVYFSAIVKKKKLKPFLAYFRKLMDKSKSEMIELNSNIPGIIKRIRNRKDLAAALELFDDTMVDSLVPFQIPLYLSKAYERKKLAIDEKLLMETGRIRDEYAKIAWKFIHYFNTIILQKVAEVCNFRRSDLDFFTVSEIVNSVKSGKFTISKSEINKRKKGVVIANINDTMFFVSGERYETIKHLLDSKLKVSDGICAFPGKVTGKIRVIKTHDQFRNIKKGDILVTYKTTHHFLPFAHKVKAILTQEGGMTCHASITAREFKIPCIVGISRIMKKFRDGDYVEVDAEKGIVKKLAKSRKAYK